MSKGDIITVKLECEFFLPKEGTCDRTTEWIDFKIVNYHLGGKNNKCCRYTLQPLTYTRVGRHLNINPKRTYCLDEFDNIFYVRYCKYSNQRYSCVRPAEICRHTHFALTLQIPSKDDIFQVFEKYLSGVPFVLHKIIVGYLMND